MKSVVTLEREMEELKHKIERAKEKRAASEAALAAKKLKPKQTTITTATSTAVMTGGRLSVTSEKADGPRFALKETQPVREWILGDGWGSYLQVVKRAPQKASRLLISLSSEKGLLVEYYVWLRQEFDLPGILELTH